MTSGSSLGPFEAVRDLHYDAPFPRMLPVRQKFDAPQVRDVAAATREALEPLRGRITGRHARRADGRQPRHPRQA